MSRLVLFLFFLMVQCYLGHAQYDHPQDGLLFDRTEVPQIEIILAPEDFQAILDDPSSNEEYPANFIFSSSSLNDTMENIGFRLRGNTSRFSQKKSFKISFNTFEAGRKFEGVEKLNLNGEHNDPSITRSLLCWDLCKELDIIAARSNHVRLYINGEYRGLYINVEHIDEEFVQKRFSHSEGNLFKCLYPADLHYKGPDPNAYKEEQNGRRTYDLKTNKGGDDYSALAHFIDVLNNYEGESFRCEIEEVFDVDTYLRAIVMDILTSNWDGPIFLKNNFYLYHDPYKDRFTYISYDLDNTFGIDWFGIDWANSNIYTWAGLSGEYRPIFEKIMLVPEFKNRFSYYMSEAIQTVFTAEALHPKMEAIKDRIEAYRVNDIFAGLDYGWSYTDFLDSYNMSLGDHVKLGLKNYVERRVASIEDQLNLVDIYPVIRYHDSQWSPENIDFSIHYFDDVEVSEAVFHYSVDGNEWMSETMDIDGDKATFLYPIDTGASMEYYFSVEDNIGQNQRYPLCESLQINIVSEELPDIVINEVMTDNSDFKKDENGEYDDWIEIYNNSNTVVPISQFYLSDDPTVPNKWSMPNTILNPNEYMIIWADGEPHQGSRHANFKLKAGGEFLGLFSSEENHFLPIDVVDIPELESNTSYARQPNGDGFFFETDEVTFDFNNDEFSSTDEPSIYSAIFYPLPSDGLFNLKGSATGLEILSISDLLGRTIDFNWNGKQLKLNDAPKGNYFCQVKNKNTYQTIKLVVH